MVTDDKTGAVSTPMWDITPPVSRKNWPGTSLPFAIGLNRLGLQIYSVYYLFFLPLALLPLDTFQHRSSANFALTYIIPTVIYGLYRWLTFNRIRKGSLIFLYATFIFEVTLLSANILAVIIGTFSTGFFPWMDIIHELDMCCGYCGGLTEIYLIGLFILPIWSFFLLGAARDSKAEKLVLRNVAIYIGVFALYSSALTAKPPAQLLWVVWLAMVVGGFVFGGRQFRAGWHGAMEAFRRWNYQRTTGLPPDVAAKAQDDKKPASQVIPITLTINLVVLIIYTIIHLFLLPVLVIKYDPVFGFLYVLPVIIYGQVRWNGYFRIKPGAVMFQAVCFVLEMIAVIVQLIPLPTYIRFHPFGQNAGFIPQGTIFSLIGPQVIVMMLWYFLMRRSAYGEERNPELASSIRSIIIVYWIAFVIFILGNFGMELHGTFR